MGIAVIEHLILSGQFVQDIQILLLGEKVQLIAAKCTLLSPNTRVDYNVTLVIYDRIKLLGRNTQQITNLVGE